MFYRTIVQRVTSDGIIDVQGKSLTFIGNKLVKAGDYVWTDGNVVFGHTPIRGGDFVPIPDSGVPVLADKLRGYFKKNGNVRDYEIKGDEWIVNDKKNYAHDDGESDGKSKIIDAEIAEDGGVYTVTDGHYLKCDSVTYNNHLFSRKHSGEFLQADKEHWMLGRITLYVGSEILLGETSENVDSSVIISKNGKKVSEFNLKKFADDVTEKSIEARDRIMEKSADISTAVDYLQQPPPPESFIAAASARILTFKINPQGEWNAIILASAYGYCYPYSLIDGSVLEATFDSETPAFDDYLPDCINSLERCIFTEKNFPFLDIERFPSFSGTKTSGGAYTAEYQKYCEAAIAYYIPLVRFTFYEWAPVIFFASSLVHVHNGNIVTVMHSRSGGGNRVMPTSAWNEQERLDVPYETAWAFVIDTETVENDWQFPIDEQFSIHGNGYSLDGVFDADGNKITSLPDFYSGKLNEPRYSYDYAIYHDPVASEINKQLGAPAGVNGVHRSSFSLPIRNISDYDGLPNMAAYYFLDEIFDTKARTDAKRDGHFRLNPSFAKLSGKNFLFGAHNEEIFIKNSGVWNLVADGLKNFRLRELKQINKAKK